MSTLGQWLVDVCTGKLFWSTPDHIYSSGGTVPTQKEISDHIASLNQERNHEGRTLQEGFQE